MSKWWAVGEDEEYIPPSVAEFIPKKRYEFKKCRASPRMFTTSQKRYFIRSTLALYGKTNSSFSVVVLRWKKR